ERARLPRVRSARRRGRARLARAAQPGARRRVLALRHATARVRRGRACLAARPAARAEGRLHAYELRRGTAREGVAGARAVAEHRLAAQDDHLHRGEPPARPVLAGGALLMMPHLTRMPRPSLVALAVAAAFSLPAWAQQPAPGTVPVLQPGGR